MKTSILTLFTLLFLSATAQNTYSRVKVVATTSELAHLAELGVTVDHGIYKQNTFFISDFSADEIAIMEINGYIYEVLIADVQKYYVDRNKAPASVSTKNLACSETNSSNAFVPEIPTNFNHGTMGGYLTYTELLAELDAMAAQYPTLITSRTPISTFLTVENRPIYHVKISDNPSTDEVGEPKVLYTSLHHAREPMSLMETVFYMWYLLENYGTNDEVTYLVNTMQLYFVPCVNPDGYVYNQTTNPNGGGMHRKNRRNVGTTNKGVDLNRNYSYAWGTTGTSTNVNNDVYPGTVAFSEAETQAIRWLVRNNHFITAFNAHTYSNGILFPIGATTAEFAMHNDFFQDETNHMAQFNGYTAMKSSSLYPASGDSDDYMYKVDIGVGQKDTIFAHTPEIGTDFWPPASEIDATCRDMLFPNFVLAHLTKKYLVVKETDPLFIPSLTGNFNHSAQRLGLENGVVTVSIEPLLNILSVGNPITYNLALRATATGSISYTLNPSIQVGATIKYILKTDNGLWVRRDTITKSYGAIGVQLVENGATANWSGNWGATTATFVSPSTSYTDSPTGNYTSNTQKTYLYTPSINLTAASAAMISYYAKWNIEADYDCVQFQVSTDGGTTWQAQCTNYTTTGNSANGSVQPTNEPVYEGIQATWVKDEINLSDYLGQVIKVRFILKSDGFSNFDGFYFDDFQVMYNMSQVVSPLAAFTVSDSVVCKGASVQFTDASSNSPTSWLWNFGDGQTSSLQSPSHTYSSLGNFSVSLTATNAAGSNTLLSTNGITIEECQGLDDIAIDEIFVYPNPTNGKFTVKGLIQGVELTVFDMNGKVIVSTIAQDNNCELAINYSAEGVYYLKAAKSDRTVYLRIVLIN